MLAFVLLVVSFAVIEIAFFQLIKFLPPGAREFTNYYLSIPFMFVAVALSFFLMNRIMGWHRLKGPSQPLEINEPEIDLPGGGQSREADQAEDKAPVTARLKDLLDDELDD